MRLIHLSDGSFIVLSLFEFDHISVSRHKIDSNWFHLRSMSYIQLAIGLILLSQPLTVGPPPSHQTALESRSSRCAANWPLIMKRSSEGYSSISKTKLSLVKWIVVQKKYCSILFFLFEVLDR